MHLSGSGLGPVTNSHEVFVSVENKKVLDLLNACRLLMMESDLLSENVGCKTQRNASTL
jgi:hypothetical protein